LELGRRQGLALLERVDAHIDRRRGHPARPTTRTQPLTNPPTRIINLSKPCQTLASGEEQEVEVGW
jgi:hypothetical protein